MRTKVVLTETDGGGIPVATVRRSVLPGGLRVITEEVAGARSASIGVWVGVGSRDEAPQLSGASHFLEHLLFKGTPRRSALDISIVMDEVGGEFNAFTAKEYTCFHARVLADDLPITIDVLGDLVTSSLITAEDVEAEREVILDEIAMHDDDPEDVVANLFASHAYAGTPLGRPIAGDPTTIRSLTRTQISRFYRSHYRAANIVVAVAGSLDHAAVVRQVRSAFSGDGFLANAAATPERPRTTGRFRKAQGGVIRSTRQFEQANLVLGFDAVARTDERREELGVLCAVLGGGASSRLFQEVRERRGLAYSVYAYPSHYSDAGSLCIAAGCLPGKLDQTLAVIRDELALIAKDGITAEELQRGKGQIRRGLVLGLEDTATRMSRIAKSEFLYGDLPSIDEALMRVEAVTLEDVRSLAAMVLSRPETLAVVAPSVVEPPRSRVSKPR